jgi:hypothetical protein
VYVVCAAVIVAAGWRGGGGGLPPAKEGSEGGRTGEELPLLLALLFAAWLRWEALR